MTRWLVTISCGIVQTLPPEMGVAGISLSKNLDCRLLRFLQNTCIHFSGIFFSTCRESVRVRGKAGRLRTNKTFYASDCTPRTT